MREYVLDANAVLRYVEGQPGCDKVIEKVGKTLKLTKLPRHLP
jgi:hypothetical protein